MRSVDRTVPCSTLSLLPLVAGFVLAAAVVVPGAVSAQTPAATVEDSDGTVVLQSNADGGLLAPGEITVGTIPAEGPGTRLMWHPAKAAFRAGRVGDNLDGTQWNDGKVGRQSVAFGLDTKASARGAVAMGDATTASGILSIALGEETVASNLRAVTAGYQTEASGRDAVAMGHQATASGKYAVAMGQATEATSGDATALGDATRATASDALAVGLETVASGKQAIALGDDTEANESDAVALGFETTASGSQSTAMGNNTTASGNQSTALGNQTVASGIIATAMGSKTVADGIGTTSVGLGTQANGTGTLAVGQCNDTDNVLFVVGNGDYSFSSPKCGQDGEDRDDAFTVNASGSATASSHDTFSDRRLKTQIESLDGDILTKLKRLRPVRYTFKDQNAHPSGEQIGLIAQNVQKEFPQLVREGANGYLSLAYPKLTAVLLKGLQEQQAQLEKKNERIAELQANQKQIQERLTALEADEPTVTAGWTGGVFPFLLAALLGGVLGAGLMAVRS